MKEFLKLTKVQQQQAINAVATSKIIDPFMIEKDFWVVLFLDLLFQKTRIGSNFAFKGGTSLSKAYHAIHDENGFRRNLHEVLSNIKGRYYVKMRSIEMIKENQIVIET